MRSQFPTPESRIQNAVAMWEYMQGAPEYQHNPILYWSGWAKKMVAMERLATEELMIAAIKIQALASEEPDRATPLRDAALETDEPLHPQILAATPD